MTPEQFDDKFRDSLEELVAHLAEHEAVEPKSFFSMVCFLENLAFFSPVTWGLIEDRRNKSK